MNQHTSRVIIVLDHATIRELEFDRSSAQLLENKEVQVIAYPPRDNNSLAASLNDQGVLSTNSVLIQSPFDGNLYAFADQASEIFAQQKHFIFTALCSHLGATEVRLEQIEIEREGRQSNFTIKASASVIPASAHADVDRKHAEEIIRKFSLRDRFAGATPNIEAAKQLLTANRLKGELSMNSLIEMRQFENKIVERKVVLSLTRESNRNLRVAVTALANVPRLASIKALADYRSSLETMSKYSLCYTVQF